MRVAHASKTPSRAQVRRDDVTTRRLDDATLDRTRARLAQIARAMHEIIVVRSMLRQGSNERAHSRQLRNDTLCEFVTPSCCVCASRPAFAKPILFLGILGHG